MNGALLRNYLVTLYRSLTRHRLYAALNVLGLAVGVAVFLTLSLYVAFETGFERWIPDAKSIYVVRTTWIVPGMSREANSGTMGGLLDELRGDYPHLVGARVWDNAATVRQGASSTSDQVEVVDPGFLRVFDLPLARGGKAGALAAPNSVLLTQARARRYFGALDPLGRRLTLSFLGRGQDYTVTGVLKDPPRGTDLKFDLVVPFAPWMLVKEDHWTHWGSEQLATYLRFYRPGAAAATNGDLDAFTDRHGVTDIGPGAHRAVKLRAQPLLSLHLIDPKEAAVVAALGAVGLLTLLLAGVNYVNLATARAELRAREVALRKVMGAPRPALVGQFMAEAVATTTLAAIVGLALCELALPSLNAAGGLALRITYWGVGSVLPFLAGVVLILGLGAGLYPALLLSGFNPASVLASARSPGGGRAGTRLREVLVVSQFAIAIAFTIATIVIVAQGRYLRKADVGFQRDGLIVVSSFDDSDVAAAQRSSLLAAWRAIPGVTSVTDADIGPGNEDDTSADTFKRPGTKGNGPSINYVTTGPDFLQTYGARLLAGRALGPDHALDDRPPVPDGASSAARDAAFRNYDRNVVLNAGAVKTFGFKGAEAALGKPLLEGLEGGGYAPMTVVGVVGDIRFRTPKKPVPPTLYMFESRDFHNAVAAIRYAPGQAGPVLQAVRDDWRRIAPGVPFKARTAPDSLSTYYKSDDERGRLFIAGAALAVAIGCLGLYGLASFAAARRVKEIGIRKTLGASTGDILRLLIGQFLRPVLLANLIAWPLAWVAMRGWLAGFDQRIVLGPSYFLAASALTLLVAVATVAGQAWTVARAEPARALRHE